MANKLKASKKYTDNCGTEHNNAYMVIDEVSTNKNRGYGDYWIKIYKDSTSRTNELCPLIKEDITVKGSEFDSYLSSAAVKADGDQYAQAYSHALTEKPVVEGINWDDWEADI